MWKRFFFIAIALLMCWQIFGQKTPQTEYIERYKAIAIKEMQRAGVPASIKLAQGILESDSGRSTLARRANNHFGMKCGSAWKGKTFEKEDDDYDADGKLIKSCFRVYKNARASYIAHSEFLLDPNKNYRYGFLFRLNPLDYKAWARGLKKAGYATSATYAQNLINTIERYELDRFDRMTSVVDEEVSEIIADIPKINGVRVTLANEGETPADVALRSSVSISRLLKYNERLNEPNQALRKSERVFLQPKRNGFRGKKKYHFVKANESMFSIAQQYGVKLIKLYRRNRMDEGSQAAEGEQIKLRGWKVRTRPRLRSEAPEEGGNTEMEWEENAPDLEGQGGFDIEFNEDDPNTNDSGPEVEDTEQLFHRVVAGDTLFGLSRKYGTTVEQIKQLNGLNNNVISVGQELRVK